MVTTNKKQQRSRDSDTDSSHSSSSDDSATDDSVDDLDFTGLVLQNRYILLTKLGAGAHATVWLSYDLRTKRYYAIKMQIPDQFDAGVDEVNFLKQISRTGCPHVNKILDDFIYDDEGEEYVCSVSELMAGSLYSVIKKGKYSNGLPIRTVKKIIYSLLKAMDSLNRTHNIVHTDIKPENILVAGISDKVNNVIAEFSKVNIEELIKRKKGLLAKAPAKALGRSRKFRGDLDTVAIYETVADTIKKMSFYNDQGQEGGDTESDTESDIEGSSESEETETETDSDSDTDTSSCPIPDKYLGPDTISICLSDFGTCLNIKKEMSYKIQTRHYQAPEIILHYPFNETCDTWSVGCVIYELLFGEILFHPDKTRRFNKDRHHLYKMISLLGKIPDHLVKTSRKRDVFFTRDGLLKGRSYVSYTPLSSFLLDKFQDHHGCSDQDKVDIVDLLYRMFEYDPEKRPRPWECMNHRLFRDIRLAEQATKASGPTQTIRSSNLVPKGHMDAKGPLQKTR